MFYKEATTLSSAGYEVTIIVQHDKTVDFLDGIRIIALPRPRNRFDRATRIAWRAFLLAWKERADIYHIHSPELIPVGLSLKLLGRTVIYDAHEAYGEKFFSRDYILPFFRPILRKFFPVFERLMGRFFDHIIAADRFVAAQFDQDHLTILANYPTLASVENVASNVPDKPIYHGKTILVYAGGLTRDRGLLQMIAALDLLSDLDIELQLFGRFEFPEDVDRVKASRNVRYLGFVTFEEILRHLVKADIGLALFQPVPAYQYAGENTTKLFEYMACGLAVIASNFQNLRNFVEGDQIGICVDPTSPEEIASSVRYFHENRRVLREMGENGRKAVLEKYNWDQEGKKLLKIYRDLLGTDCPIECATDRDKVPGTS
jgi:glycosyltransferase involved in cell wall biosynthesis